MVREIQPREQSIGEVNISGGSNNVFQQKASNLAGFNAAFQEVTDPIAEGILSAEAEGKRLAKYEAEKDLPLELIPKEEGGFNPLSLTKWGRIYDKSYNEIDKQLVGYKAQEALTENAMMLSRPENQGPGITQRYADQSQAIIQAYVDSAAPANRNELTMSLTAKAREKEFHLAETEANYNRIQIKSQLENTTTKLDADLLEAGYHNDTEKIAQLSKELESNVNAQANLNLISHADAVAQKEDIASRAKQAYVTGQYIQAKSEGLEDAFLRDLGENPERYNLTIGETKGIVDSILEVKGIEEKASNEYYTMQGLQATADIYSGVLKNKTDLDKYDLNPQQYLKLSAAIDKNNATKNKKAKDYTQAINEISAGQGSGVDKALVDGLQDDAVMAVQDQIGRVLTLPEQYDVLRGQSEIPASTIPGISLGTNVPSFDRRVSGALTSEDPEAMYQGYQVYQASLTSGEPNTLNLSDQAMQTAVMMRSQIEANVDPVTAAQRATTTILHAKESGIQTRLQEIDSAKLQNKMPRAFKSALGANSDINSQVFGDFKNQVRALYATGSTFNDAVEVAANNFRGYKESKYFIPGTVGQMAPESTLPIIGYEFDNQFAGTIQEKINNGMYGVGGLPVKWANPEDAIDLKTLDRNEWVDKPLPAVTKRSFGGLVLSGGELQTRLPRIKIGDHESDVYLIAGTRVRYGDNGQPIYQLGYKDRLGYLQPLNDDRGPNSAATFTPKPLDVYAKDFGKTYNVKQRQKEIREFSRLPVNKAMKGLLTNHLITPFNVKDSLIDLNNALEAEPKLRENANAFFGLTGEE